MLESKSMGLENGLGSRKSSWGSNTSCCVMENTWESWEKSKEGIKGTFSTTGVTSTHGKN